MNEQNLIPGNHLSPEEAQRNGKKGAEKSAEVRRENKVLAKWLERNDSSGVPYGDRIRLELLKMGMGTCWDVDLSQLTDKQKAQIELERKKLQLKAIEDILTGTGELKPEQTLNIKTPKKDSKDVLKFFNNGGRL